MEEGVAAPVARIDTPAQVVPAVDLVHRLVADDLFQNVRRRRPVDAPQHQEAAVEPGREQMDEVVVDGPEVVLAMGEHVEQLLAHAHQRDGAAGREIEPAEQLLPARLGGRMHLGCGLVGRIVAPGGNRRLQAGRVGPEALRQRLEEGDARAGREFRVAGEDIARHRDAGGLAAAGQQVVAELDQALGAGRVGAAPLAGAVNEARGRARRSSATSRRKTTRSCGAPCSSQAVRRPSGFRGHLSMVAMFVPRCGYFARIYTNRGRLQHEEMSPPAPVPTPARSGQPRAMHL